MRDRKTFLAVPLFLLASVSTAACPEGELRFSFDSLPLQTAFVLIADYAGKKVELRDRVGKVVPVNFPCTPWRQAAQELADKHQLSLRIDGQTLYISE